MLKSLTKMTGASSSSQRQTRDQYAVLLRRDCEDSSNDESSNGETDSEQENEFDCDFSGGLTNTNVIRNSTTETSVPSNAEARKKNPPRGPNKCSNLSTNEKTIVKVNCHGQAVGKNARKLSSYIGILARDPKLVPLDLKDWRKFKTDEKEEFFWKIILAKFMFEGSVSAKVWAMDKMNHCLRSWRKKLKNKHYKPGKSLQDMLKPPNNRVDPEQWANMVHRWESKEGKESSKRNLENRSSSKMTHHLGTKSYARLRDEMTTNGKEPDRLALFEKAYGVSKKKPVDPTSKQKIADIAQRLETLSPDSDVSNEREKIYDLVVGEDKRGYKRTYGIGVKTPTTGSSKQKVTEALELVEEERRKRRALEEDIASEKQKRLELEQEVSNQAQKNKELEEQMGSEKEKRKALEDQMRALSDIVMELRSIERYKK